MAAIPRRPRRKTKKKRKRRQIGLERSRATSVNVCVLSSLVALLIHCCVEIEILRRRLCRPPAGGRCIISVHSRLLLVIAFPTKSYDNFWGSLLLTTRKSSPREPTRSLDCGVVLRVSDIFWLKH